MDEQAPLRQLTADPGFLLSRVGAAVRAGFKDVLANWGVRPQQYLVLLILDGSDGLSQQALCTAARVDSGNMVELLDGLEAHGYAQRARDPRDRRRYLVTITPAGRTALAELRQAVARYDQRFFNRLSPAEQRQLVATLTKLYDGPTQPRPQNPHPPNTPENPHPPGTPETPHLPGSPENPLTPRAS